MYAWPFAPACKIRAATTGGSNFRMGRAAASECIPGVVYTDGSMADGPPKFGGVCGRLGWSFVAVDNRGRTVASAHGSPAAWVTTVYGAEVWALFMAATHALPAPRSGPTAKRHSVCSSAAPPLPRPDDRIMPAPGLLYSPPSTTNARTPTSPLCQRPC